MKLKQLGGFLFHWALPLLVLSSAGMGVMMLGKKEKPNRKKAKPQRAVPVEIARAQSHDGPLTIAATGVVVPFREVALPTEVSGRVIWKSDALLPGKYVNAGDELLKIDTSDYDLEVSRLKQLLVKAESDLARVAVDKINSEAVIKHAQETLDSRSRELNRIRQLRQQRAASESELEVAERSHIDAKQQLTLQKNLLRGLDAEQESLESTRQLAAIGLQKAELDLTRTVIVAPFSGVVISHVAETGAHIKAGDTIATVEDTGSVEVRCNLRKEDLEFLPSVAKHTDNENPADAYRLPPLEVTVIYTRAGREYSWNGVLSRQDGLGMDERTRTMPVRVLVNDPRECRVHAKDPAARPIALMRGMFVNVHLHCKSNRPLLRIPEETIRPGKTVWIMEDERLRIQPVHIARIESGMAYVEARGGQLSQNQFIISSPVPGAKEGLAVTSSAAKPASRQGKGPAGKGGRGRREQKKPEASTALAPHEVTLASGEAKP